MNFNAIKQYVKKSSTVVLTAAMVVANVMPVMADTPTTSGDVGEGVATINAAPADVFTVTVPTSLNFDFDIDPGKQLYGSLTDGADTYADSTLLFANTGDKYSDTTDPIEVTSEATVDLKINVKGKLENVEGIAVAESIDAAESAETPSIAIVIGKYDKDNTKFIEGEGNPVALTTAGATISDDLESWKDNYDTKTDGDPVALDDGGYLQKWKYDKKGTTTDPIKHYFALQGTVTAASDTVSWANVKKAPKLKVVYEIKKADGTTISTLTISYDSYSVEIPDAEGAISSVKFYGPGSDTPTVLTSGSHYSYNSSTKTLTMVNRNVVKADNAGGKLVVVIGEGTYNIEIVE